MIGIDGHVSFLPPKKKKNKKVGLTACLDGLPRLLCACRLQRKGLATRQSQAYPASVEGPSPHVLWTLHDMIIATLQDRSAWHGLVAPCFPH